jgi:hypothetical protein
MASRAAAVRAARDAKAARDKERQLREARIESALADFYEASGLAGQIRAQAQARADKILADAEEDAAAADRDARQAIRGLREIGQTNAEIADLCGVSVAVVRAMANEPDDQIGLKPDKDAEADGESGSTRALAGRAAGGRDDDHDD